MKFQRATILTAAAFIVAAATSAGASVSPTWLASKNAVLPSGATSLFNGNLALLSCPAAGYCAAGGIDQDSNGNTFGLLLNEVAGVWRDPTNVTPPSNAVVADGVSVNALACGAPESCSAIGTYSDTAINQLSFVVDEVSGVWQKAVEVTLPTNSVKSSQVSNFRSIACASAGNCSAVGSYSAGAGSNSTQEAFVLNEVGGHWGSASEVTLPTNTNFNPFATLAQIACASAGNCSAAGSYIDATNVNHALVVNEVGGTWRAGLSLLAPGSASNFAGATLSEVSCASAGNCAAVGTFNATGGPVQMLVDNETNSTWGRASEVQLPSSAATNPHVLLYGFSGVSCPSAGNCTTGAQYRDKAGNYQGLLVNEINGHWQTGTQLTLPTGALQAGKNGGVVSVSCVAAGDCSAGAAYEDSSGNYQALVVNETNHSWAAGTKISLPAGASTVGAAGGVYSVSCQRSGACTAVGSYETSTGTYLGFTDQTA
jgi:hypothetical protein